MLQAPLLLQMHQPLADQMFTSKVQKSMTKAMVLIGAIAFVLSFILCIHAFSGKGLIGCSAGTSCNQVLGSRWSFIMGLVPVSGLASIVYLLLTFCIAFRDRLEDDPELQKYIDMTVLVLTGAITGSAVWFIWLQKNFIRAFCPYCMSAHILGIILSLMIIVYKARSFKHIASICCGIILAAGLAGLQLMTTPRTAYDRGFVPEQLPESIPSELPSYGNQNAPNVVTLLYDYRCSHCQKIHGMLPELAGLLGPDYVIVTRPVPLSMACNPYIRASEDRFAGSCELTRLALALWRYDRDAFRAFDSWLFEADSRRGWYPRNPEEALAKAQSLIGPEKLQSALNDSWIESYLSSTFELFGRTSNSDKSGIPRFIHDGRWLVPDTGQAEALATLIKEM